MGESDASRKPRWTTRRGKAGQKRKPIRRQEGEGEGLSQGAQSLPEIVTRVCSLGGGDLRKFKVQVSSFASIAKAS